MKASLKFREQQKPLIRAKVPLNILGFPFQSGIVAGESKELSLNLSTFFESGPSLKFAYRPNDSLNPFSLVFKTGIGHFGSPISSSMNMSAEFNLIGGQNPSFFINFKPQFGDFAIKKCLSSVFKKQSKANGCVSIEDGPVMVDNVFLPENGKSFTVLPLETPVINNVVNGVLFDVDVSARTAVPLRKHAVMNFRWGVRFPASNSTAGISFDKFPMLVMNKIGIEHVGRDDSNKVGPNSTNDVAEACLDVKRQLEMMHAENGMTRKAMDDLKADFFAVNRLNYREGERGERKFGGSKIWSELNGGYGRKVFEGDEVINEDLKNGLKGTAGV